MENISPKSREEKKWGKLIKTVLYKLNNYTNKQPERRKKINE